MKYGGFFNLYCVSEQKPLIFKHRMPLFCLLAVLYASHPSDIEHDKHWRTVHKGIIMQKTTKHFFNNVILAAFRSCSMLTCAQAAKPLSTFVPHNATTITVPQGRSAALQYRESIDKHQNATHEPHYKHRSNDNSSAPNFAIIPMDLLPSGV